MAVLSVKRSVDFRTQALSDITDIHFTGHQDSFGWFIDQTATFNSTQFGPGLISDTVIFTRGKSIATVEVHFSAGSTEFDARGWTFAESGIGGSFVGTAGSETLYGTRYFDRIDLGPGNDTIYAGRGNDLIFSDSDSGADHIDGGPQRGDTVSLHRQLSSLDFVLDIRKGGGGNDIGDGTTLAGIEQIFVILGSGDDFVVGGRDHDFIATSGGNDVINGGRSGDDLRGGDGNDRFVFERLADSGVSRHTYDEISGFMTSLSPEPDKIDISRILMDLGITLTLSANASFTGIAGEMLVTHEGTRRTFLDMDADGDRASDFRIKFDGDLNFTLDDFILT